MATYFIKRGNTFRTTDSAALDIHEALPVGNYILRSGMMGFFLEIAPLFDMPRKLYGSVQRDAERILYTFQDRPATTGVLLSGHKGSGKTLLAKQVTILAATAQVPTILVNEAYSGPGFNAFLASITQSCAVMFDEFEKVYEKKEQEEILTLLDGTYGGKKLYILTCNDMLKVNQYMRNRPGRMFYSLEFKGLDAAFVQEYCKDRLKDQSDVTSVVRLTMVFDSFSFDMLQAIVEEMNRYGEGVNEVLKMLNARPEFVRAASYAVKLTVDDREVPEAARDDWRGNPLMGNIDIVYYDSPATEAKETSHRFDSDDFVSIRLDLGMFALRNKKGALLVLTERKPKAPDFAHILSL